MITSREALVSLAILTTLIVLPAEVQSHRVFAEATIGAFGQPGCSFVAPSSRLSVGTPAAPATSIHPPQGFNPLTASNTTLGCYGFPLRPSNPDALKRWQTLMVDATHYVAPQLLYTSSVHFATNGFWSGYHAQATSNGSPYWDEVDAENDSVAGERSNDGHRVGNWVGFGGYNSTSYLTQLGTDLHDDGTYNGQGSIYFFDEWVNLTDTCCGIADVGNLPISKGNDVYYQLNYVYQSNYSAAFFENKATGNYTNLNFASGKAFNNDTVEWEAEDATGSYTSYNGEEYLSPEVWTSSGVQQYAANLSTVADWMGVKGGTTYMKPSAFQTDCCHRFYEIPQN